MNFLFCLAKYDGAMLEILDQNHVGPLYFFECSKVFMSAELLFLACAKLLNLESCNICRAL